MPDQPDYQDIPEVTQIDELQTYIGKKNKILLWNAFNKGLAGILAYVIGDRSAETFKPDKENYKRIGIIFLCNR